MSNVNQILVNALETQVNGKNIIVLVPYPVNEDELAEGIKNISALIENIKTHKKEAQEAPKTTDDQSQEISDVSIVSSSGE